MAMITGFLFAYFLFTAPAIAWGVYRTAKRPANSVSDTVRIIEEIHQLDRTVAVDFVATSDKLGRAERDHGAMLQVMKEIAQALLDIKIIAKDSNTPQSRGIGTVDNFVHELEYARDKFAKTPAQKRTIESIISTVRLTYGPETK